MARLVVITQHRATETSLLIRSLVVWVCSSVTGSIGVAFGALGSIPPNQEERKITLPETSV